jgi:hypothetical protein
MTQDRYKRSNFSEEEEERSVCDEDGCISVIEDERLERERERGSLFGKVKLGFFFFFMFFLLSR